MQTPTSSSYFLRLFKKNKSRDKVLISADAICSIEERAEDHAVRIYTMDGFWYDVEDAIDAIANVLPCKGVARQTEEHISCSSPYPNPSFLHKGRGLKKRKFQPPMAAENTHHESRESSL